MPPSARPQTRFAALSGLVFALLFGIGNLLWFPDAPEFVGDPDEIARFYLDHSGAVIAGATMSMIGIAFFLVFAGIVHRILARADGRGGWLPTVALGGALVAVAAGLCAEAVNAAAAIRAEEDGGISPQAAQVYFDIAQMLGFPAAAIGAAVFGGATAMVALRSGRPLPRWFAWLTLALALALLSPFSFLGMLLIAPWVAIVSLLIFARESRAAPPRSSRS